MRASLARVVLTAALGFSVVAQSPTAQANDMDPVLSRLWELQGGQIVTRDDLYDALALEYAMAFAPGVHYPAETLGWSGFFMGLEGTLTVIDSDGLHMSCGIENFGNTSEDNPGGGNRTCDGWDAADSVAFVPAVHVRKGLPYSIELGFQVQYMSNTELVGIGGEVRWAPFEGFRSGWMGFLPDVSLAFTGNYIMGSTELALGQLGILANISYPFTISGQMTLTPFAGYNFMFVGADHEQVLNSYYLERGADAFEARYGNDASPYLDFHDGESRNFGQGIATLKYQRIFFGVRILWERLAVTPQVTFTVPAETGVTTDFGAMRFQMGISVGTDF